MSAASHADHDRHRGGETQGAWAGDDENADGREEAKGKTRLGAVACPRSERRDSHHDNGQYEPARDLIGQTLDGRARPLSLGHHLYDLRQHGVAADLLGAHDEAPDRFNGPPKVPAL